MTIFLLGLMCGVAITAFCYFLALVYLERREGDV